MQQPFEVRLSVVGNLDAKESQRIVTPDFDSRQEIGWIAESGVSVKAGEKLVEFDTSGMLKDLLTAETELELARTKVAQEQAKLRLKLAGAEADIREAELDLEVARMRQTDSETVPLVERERARVSATKSQMAIEAARANLETVKLESEAETQLQQLKIDENVAEVEKLQKQLDKAVLTAPADGIVLLHERWDGTAWRVGSKPWGGATLIKLPEMGTMEVTAWVHEVDTPRIEAGQTAIVTIDAYPDSPVTGTIEKVADLAIARGDDEVKYLEVTVALDETRPEMKPGMTVRVDLLLERVESAMVVPLESVVTDGEATPKVFTSSLTGFSAVEVELGPENDTHVIVETGVSVGQVVALVDPETFGRDGERPVAIDDGPKGD